MQTYGWLSLLPPLVAIALAIVSRRVLSSLFTGIVIGAVLIVNGPFEIDAPATNVQATDAPVVAKAADNSELNAAPTEAKGPGNPEPPRTYFGAVFKFFGLLCESLLWENLIEKDHLRVFAFTTLMSCMVSVMHRGGAMQALVRLLEPFAKGRRGSQLITWLIGLLIFFDDYANTLLVGSSMQAVTDRWKISREKLAYLVDSTAAPVAGLALISTWVATEINFIEKGLSAQEVDFTSGFAVFVNTIPYRFYALLALAYVAVVAITGRDFGPMLGAERRALETERHPKATTQIDSDAPSSRWYDAILPVAVILFVTLFLLTVTGSSEVKDASASWLEIICKGNAYVALQYGAVLGLATTALLTFVQRHLKWREIQAAIRDGALFVIPALAILWFSWTLSSLCENHLYTGAYLADKIGSSLPIFLIPTISFVLAGGVSFATGTSWGTMGLLMPLIIKLTVQLMTNQQMEISSEDPILLGAIGGVLAGAIFGDHCSPISDTTVLSSQASGCDHIAHVRTQLPYAILVGVVSILFGTLPVGLGFPASVCCLVGLVVLIGFTFAVGQTSDS
ncbi:MAG: Na+/H+ antiporter NhaC [Pirellulaceae bacterium]|jgi:Na+/H+ antiporter NhaC